MLAPAQIDALEQAVARAQEAGGKQVRARATTIGGQDIPGPELRWVEVAEPPVVYLPDAQPTRKGAIVIGFGVAMVLAFLALIFAIVAATMADWLATGILGAAALGLGGLGLWLDKLDGARRAAARAEVETLGLYLTPTAMLLRTPAGRTVVAREHVLRFGVERISPASEPGLRHALYVEVNTSDGARRIRLQDGSDRHQLEICQGWLAGPWPPPLPR